jgi:hypothetical protein
MLLKEGFHGVMQFGKHTDSTLADLSCGTRSCEMRDRHDSYKSRYTSVVNRWAAGWMIGGSSTGRGWQFLSSPPRPDLLSGPPTLLSCG